MEQINICGFSDLLRYAEQTVDGLFYNGAHELFVKADKFEGQIYVEDIQHELDNYSDQLSDDEITVYKVIVAFAEYHSSKSNVITEFHIAPKNW